MSCIDPWLCKTARREVSLCKSTVVVVLKAGSFLSLFVCTTKIQKSPNQCCHCWLPPPCCTPLPEIMQRISKYRSLPDTYSSDCEKHRLVFFLGEKGQLVPGRRQWGPTCPWNFMNPPAIIRAFDLKNVLCVFLHICKYLHFPLMPAKSR